MFTQQDKAQIKEHGLNIDAVELQMENFRKGFAYLPVERAAMPADGIVDIDKKTAEYYAAQFLKDVTDRRIVKFVPASGAATRMFKDLFGFVENGEQTPYIEKLLNNIEKFAFNGEIEANARDAKATVQSVLDYGAGLPKALILFHNYADGPRTAVEEHMAEGAMYARSGDQVHIHFTISPEHEQGFRKLLAQKQTTLEKKFGVRYSISFSQQQSGTDTIAVTPDNEPFRNDDGTLLFRPAGHGALIANLDDIDADIIFIKTVDNVAPDHLKADTVLYKKALGGMLSSLQQKAFNYLHLLDRGADNAMIENIRRFANEELMIGLPMEFGAMDNKKKTCFLRELLNRPIRVCGMVRNEGEPGGGPFWAMNANGTVTLQIAEPSQLSPEKAHLLKEGTHFNPVDLVCGVMDYKGSKFDLTKYTDPSTGFISEKSKSGRPLKAQELPGLWNGAMSNWITVFATVPVSTFSPVKVVNDLLRPQHQ